MKKLFIISISILLSLLLKAQQPGSFIDNRDGKNYKTVKIGDQVWMAENLNFEINRDSCCYENKSSNCSIYGKMYDWNSAKNICPIGWHLPSKSDFEILLSKSGGSSSNDAYSYLIEGGRSGFNAKLGGRRDYIFRELENAGYFWTSTEENSKIVGSVEFNSQYKIAAMSRSSKDFGFSIRCLKD